MSVVSPDGALLWDGFAAGELRLPWCNDCGRAHLPPGPVCPFCLGERLEWRGASGVGTVSSFVTVLRGVFADWPLPYMVVQVELAEGPRLTAGAAGAHSIDLHVGMSVVVGFAKLPNDHLLPVVSSTQRMP